MKLNLLCTKTLHMDDGEVAFIKGKEYKVVLIYEMVLINNKGFKHRISTNNNNWVKNFVGVPKKRK